MSALGWIVIGGLAMTAIALVGSVTLLLEERTLDRWILPLVAFAAGTLLGGALFHMLPGAVDELGNRPVVYLWAVAGFGLFFALEQFLHRHGSHREQAAGVEPLTYLVLLGDGLHNLLGGWRWARPSSSTSGWAWAPGSPPRPTRSPRSSGTSGSWCTGGGVGGAPCS